jgi:hypothetical protein
VLLTVEKVPAAESTCRYRPGFLLGSRPTSESPR